MQGDAVTAIFSSHDLLVRIKRISTAVIHATITNPHPKRLLLSISKVSHGRKKTVTAMTQVNYRTRKLVARF